MSDLPQAQLTSVTPVGEQANAAPRQRVTKLEDKRRRPWQGHWPPKEGTDLNAAYGFKKGEKVHIYGN
jgi:hypothetical protein